MPPRKSNLNICDECKKDVGSEDKALVCCVCEKWFHINCQRVTLEDYKFLVKSDDSIQWYCKGCRGASLKLITMLTLVSKRQDQLEEEVKKLNNGMKEFNNKMDTQSSEFHDLMKDVSEIKNGMPAMISEKVSEMIMDKQEEESRVSNMIFFNVEEVKGGNSKESDAILIGEVLDSLNIELERSQLANITRLGRVTENGSKIRPIRVRIENRGKRGEILRNAFKLKGLGKLSKVGIGRDLNQKQREHNANLRKLLEEKRTEYPGQMWVIRRDKIVEQTRVVPPDAVPDAGNHQK
ncbi:hypothetical protein DPMN_044789 [Dreissena polymorpha]|uniref:PHD-type domain-containing protein n=1 Tax=Dreissena polymorpha TaxID=45954 RepID=A0A9D4I0S8_DREPO|nr:hypothetical protein DPMN_044789 [Dreissena polymorpha]